MSNQSIIWICMYSAIGDPFINTTILHVNKVSFFRNSSKNVVPKSDASKLAVKKKKEEEKAIEKELNDVVKIVVVQPKVLLARLHKLNRSISSSRTSSSQESRCLQAGQIA